MRVTEFFFLAQKIVLGIPFAPFCHGYHYSNSTKISFRDSLALEYNMEALNFQDYSADGITNV